MEFTLSFGLLKFGISMRLSRVEFKKKIIVGYTNKGQGKS